MATPKKNNGNIGIALVRKLEVPARMVYAAWTKPTMIAQWLAPGDDAITGVTMDLRQGGRYRLDAIDSHGRPYSICGRYLELIENRRIAISWCYDGPVAALRGGPTLVAADLKPIGTDRTELTLTHEKLAEREAAEIIRVDWDSCLEKLRNAAHSADESQGGVPSVSSVEPPAVASPSSSASIAKEFFTEGQRRYQDHFGTRRLADRLESATVHDRLKAADAAFIAHQNMFFLATTDVYGQPNCSYKGGARGFVTVVDDKTLAFPDYDGNGMHLSIGNLSETGKVGLLFIDFERQARLRVLGQARVHKKDRLLKRYPGALLIVRVTVESIFSNCPRYVHKMQLVEESEFVPKADAPQPAPGWKRLRTVADVLPEGDRHLGGTDSDDDQAMNRG